VNEVSQSGPCGPERYCPHYFGRWIQSDRDRVLGGDGALGERRHHWTDFGRISAVILLATLAQLSFGSSFERFLPVAGAQTRIFVKRAYVMCTSVGLVLAVAYIALGFSHSFLTKTLGWHALFVDAVVMWTVFSLQDSVLIRLRSSKWVPVENISAELQPSS
jgi:hypothetical protein